LQRAEQEMNQRVFSPPQIHYTNGVLSTAKHPYDTEARFKTLRRLGRGSFGQVDEVEEITTGNVYARKSILLGGKNTATTRREEEIEKEFRIMEKLTHTHITTVLFWLRSETVCSIIMKPACDMDLRCYLERCIYHGYPADQLRQMLPWPGCLLEALAFAHRLNVIHKDIKPSNILIKDSHVYLADFGLAKDDMADKRDENGTFSVWGASVYRAPEITPNHLQTHGTKADVFSLGCAFSEMLTVCGRRSLQEYQESRYVADGGGWTVAFRSSLPQVAKWLDALRGHSVDSVADTLIWHTMSMLHEDPEQRTSARAGVTFLMGLSQREMVFCPLHN
jgi:serine/threonine protein kinase